MSESESSVKEAGAKKAGLPVIAIAALAVALVAVGLSVFMFLQVGKLSAAAGGEHGELPAGLQPEGEHGEGAHELTMAVHPDSQQVVYELGDFTANTSDGKFTKMNISLVLDSYYTQEAWEAFQSEQKLYDEKLRLYYDFKSGKVDAEGKPLGEHAMAGVELMPAAHGAPKEPEPPKMPEKVERPLTLMEIALEKENAMVRDVIISEINGHSAPELTTSEGIDHFKNNVIDALNEAVDRHLGTVKDIYFKDRVTT